MSRIKHIDRGIFACAVILLSFSFGSLLKAQTTFQRTAGLEQYERPYSVLRQGDGYLVAGSTNSRGEGGWDAMLMKTDLNFNTVWASTLGGPDHDNPQSVIATADGGFLFIGQTKSFGAGEEDILAIKLAADYSLVWAKAYGGPTGDIGYCAIEFVDGFLIGGSTAGGTQAMAIKIDLNGNIAWSKTFGAEENAMELYNVVRNENGNYIFDTPYQSMSQGYNYMLVEVSATGNLLMAKSYSNVPFGTGDDYSRDLLLVPGDGYYLFGHSFSFGNGSSDLHLIKTGIDGEVQWARNYANPDDLLASQIVLTSNNDLIMTAQIDQLDEAGIDIIVVQTDASGNLQWSYRYGGFSLENQSRGNHETLIEVDPNLFVLFGKTSSFGAGQEDVYIVGFDRNGDVPCNVEDISINVSSPNIAAEDVTIPVANINLATTDLSLAVNMIGLADSLLCPLQPPPLALFEASDTMICVGGCINFADLSLQDPEQWRWRFEGTIPDTSLLPSPTGICYPDTGCFDVQLIVSNAGGPDTLLIKDYICVYPYPEVSLGNDTSLCYGDTVYLEVPSGYSSYLWNTGETGTSLEVSESGQYWVTVGNEAGCQGSDTIKVEFNSFLVIDLGPDRLICEGDSVQLNAGSGFDDYLWQDGSANSTLMVNSTGYYWVEVSDDLGCTGGDTVYVEVAANPVVSLGRDTLICEWETYTFDGGDGYAAYLWQDGSGERFFTAGQTGEYWVEVTDGNGCRDSDTASLRVVYLPALDIGNDTSFCENFSLYLDAGPGWDTYRWQDGSDKPDFTAASYGAYWVLASVEGCAQSDTIMITEDCPSLLWFPNSFTPNGDGLNDTFGPAYDNVDIFQVRIFSRWGQLVFESRDIEQGWDGKISGEDCPVGVYYFVAEYTDNQKGEVVQVKGSLTLIR